ncbi:MAG TPA: hypothetical protein VGN12_10375 [Pirellulales bacterium]|jgi:hypothetical protein
MAVPIRPVNPGDLISAAKFNEVVDALNALGQISGSYPIEIARDAMGVRVGLARQAKMWLFRLETVPDSLPRTSDNVPYYNATRLRLDTSADYVAQSPQHVQLYDPLAKDAASKQLAEGTWVLANFDADTGRWQIVRDPFIGPVVVRFKLTSTLSLGGNATATIRRWDPTAGGGSGAYVDGDTITVKDYFGALGDPGEWQGFSGFYGFAAQLPDRSEYQILYMEHVARFVAFTLTGTFLAGSAVASFDSTWAGKPGAGAGFINDRQNLYTSAAAGDKGIAAWDESQEEYVVIDMGKGRASDLVLAYLNADLAQGASAAATIRKWDAGLGTWTATGGSVTVFDSSNLGPASTSDVGVCFLSSQSGRYELVALEGSRGVQVVRFKLTTTLLLGGTASALIQTYSALAAAYVDGDAITVVDFYGSLGGRGKFQAPSGYYGFAIKLADKDEWQILDMERQALFADVTLTANMASGTATCTFDNFWDGQSTASETTIFDTLNFYSAAVTGDKFRVVWDSHDGKYKIIDAKPATAGLIRYARTYASHTLAGSSKSNAHFVECQAVDDLSGEGYDAGGTHFNVLLPSPSAASDPNVEAGVTIGYTVDGAGNKICVTDYLDDCRGTIKLWSGAAVDISHGWDLCDGSNGTPNLCGKFVLGARPGGGDGRFDDNGSQNDIGDTGGTLKHTHAPHAPAATSSTSLAAVSTTEATTDSEFTGKPLTITITPNMTGSPIASGVTGPTPLEVEVFFPNIVIEPTDLTVDTSGLTVGDTSLNADHNHEITPLEKVWADIGADADIYSPSATEQATDIIDPNPHDHPLEGTAEINPNPHTHDVTEDQAQEPNLVPNPHTHTVNAPVTGITFSPSTTVVTPAGTIISDTAVAVATTIAPPSHTHQTPTLTHDAKYHTPTYYALCYIMRTG